MLTSQDKKPESMVITEQPRYLLTSVTMPSSISPDYLAESSASIIRGSVWTSTAVALLMVILRCYTRLWLRKVFGLDDVLILISMVRFLF
jgi:hypothetical protein